MEDKKYAFVDHREFGFLEEKNKNPNLEIVLLDSLLKEAEQMKETTNPTNKLALRLLQKYELHNAASVDIPWNFPVSMADFLRLKGVKLTLLNSFYPERTQKNPVEVDAIRGSISKTEEAFTLIEEILSESVIQDETLLYQEKILTSELLKKQVEQLLLAKNMMNEEGIIISSGLETAIPHHPGEGPIKAHQPIVCDIFPRNRSTGYFADLTRTFIKGKPSSELQAMYEAVLKAQEEGVGAVKPGIRANEVHRVCAQVLVDLGYDVGDKGFIHGTGHGVGLDVHEKPILGETSEDVLQSGNIVTVEPGLYYPKLGGIRIEDDVLVTENGADVLSGYHKNWIIP